MPKARMKSGVCAVIWWAAEMLIGILFQLVPPLILLLSPDGAEGGLLLYALCLYALQPLAAALLPAFLVIKKGVNPYAAFFPIGLCLLFSPTYSGGTAIALLCLGLSLVSAAVGTEFLKRSMSKKR